MAFPFLKFLVPVLAIVVNLVGGLFRPRRRPQPSREEDKNYFFSSAAEVGDQGDAIPFGYGEVYAANPPVIGSYLEVGSQESGEEFREISILLSGAPNSGDVFTIAIKNNRDSETISQTLQYTVPDNGLQLLGTDTDLDLFDGEPLELFPGTPIAEDIIEDLAGQNTNPAISAIADGDRLELKSEDLINMGVVVTTASTTATLTVDLDRLNQPSEVSNPAFHLLYLLGHGEVEGFANSVRESVFFNSQPLNALDPDDTVPDPILRSGTADQEPIGALPGEASDFTRVRILKPSPVSRPITNQVEKGGPARFRIDLREPIEKTPRVGFVFRFRLLRVEAQNPGNDPQEPHEIRFRILIQNRNGGTAVDTTIAYSAKAPDGIQRVFGWFDLDGQFPYSVSILKTSPDADEAIKGRRNTSQLIDDMNLDFYQVEFDPGVDAEGTPIAAYPGYAIASVVVPSDLFDGEIPDVRLHLNLLKVREFGSGVMSAARSYTDDPARCLVDYLTNPIYGWGLRDEQIAIARFIAASEYWSGLVSNGQGGTEPRYRLNWLGDSAPDDPLELLRNMASAAASGIFWDGSSVYPVVDGPSTPVAIVNPDGVVTEQFDGQITPGLVFSGSESSERFSILEVEFEDLNALGERSFLDYDEFTEAIERFGELTSQLPVFGATTESQARRLAAARLLFAWDSWTANFGLGAEGSEIEAGDWLTIRSHRGDEIFQVQAIAAQVEGLEYSITAAKVNPDKYAIIDVAADTSDTFLPTPIGDWAFVGDATEISSTEFQVVPPTASAVGAVWRTDPLLNTAIDSWSVSFRFRISSTESSAKPPDGAAFVLQPAGSSAIGGNGGDLGIYPLNSVVVEFDAYQNDYDQSTHRIGIHTGGDKQASIAEAESPDLLINITWHCRIDYAGGTLGVFVGLASDSLALIVSSPVAIRTLLGDRVFWGFTASNGKRFGQTRVFDPEIF